METETKWFESSSGNGDLALTIKGLLMLLVPSLLLISQTLGFNWSETDITNWIILVSSALTGVILFLGVVRKIYFALQK